MCDDIRYKYSKEDEEIYKEFMEINNDFCSPDEHINAGKFFCKLITSKSDL